MFGERFTNPFSLNRIVGGLSKTLGVINEVIPIYKEAKPLVANAKSTINSLKELGNNALHKIEENKVKNITPFKEKISNINTTNFNRINKPTFFQ